MQGGASIAVTQIVLHIGAEKTGTTSLQAALAKNAGRLLDESSLLYPCDPPLATGIAHFGLAAAFLDAGQREFAAPAGIQLAELHEALAAEIARRRPRIAVLSAEHFSSRFQHPQIEALARFLEPYAVRIVYYARRQDEMAAGAFGTGLVAGRRDWFDIDAIRPGEFYYDHCQVIDQWAAVFDVANLRVRNYSDFAEMGLIEDFLTEAGVSPLPALAVVPRANRALTIREAQFLHALNQHLPTWEESLAGEGAEAFQAGGRERQRLLWLLRQDATLPDSPPLTSLIGEAESVAIMSRFAKSNAGLAEKYGVSFAARRKGPVVAVRPGPLEPAVLQLLAMKGERQGAE